MDHTFTFFVLVTALIAFFIEELSAAAKRFWKNQFLRHSGLMMFIGIMGFGYQVNIKQLFTLILKYTSIFSSTTSSFIPIFQNKVLISLALIHSLYTFCFVGLFMLFYFIAKKIYFKPWHLILWAFWLVVGAMYLSVIDVPTLFQT